MDITKENETAHIIRVTKEEVEQAIIYYVRHNLPAEYNHTWELHSKYNIADVLIAATKK